MSYSRLHNRLWTHVELTIVPLCIDSKDIARAAAAQLDRYTTSSPSNDGKGDELFTSIRGVDIRFEKAS